MSGPILPNAKGVGGLGGRVPSATATETLRPELVARSHSQRSPRRGGCPGPILPAARWVPSGDRFTRPGRGPPRASISSSSRTASRNPSAQSKNAPPGRTGPGALVFPNERHRFSVVLIDGVRASPYLENSVFWRRVSILLRLLLLIRDNPSYEFPFQL